MDGSRIFWECPWGDTHDLGTVDSDDIFHSEDKAVSIPLERADQLAWTLKSEALREMNRHMSGQDAPITLDYNGRVIVWEPTGVIIAAAGPQWTHPGDLYLELRRALPFHWRRSLWADVSMDLRLSIPEEDLHGVRYEAGERATVVYLAGEREAFNVTIRDNYCGYTLEVLFFESGAFDQYRINYGSDDARRAREAIVDRLKWRVDGRFNMPAS